MPSRLVFVTRRSPFLFSLLALAAIAAHAQTRRITWADVTPFHARLTTTGLSPASFDAYVERTHAENLRRVHEGDLDHLVYYLLQSTRMTTLAPIEPAVSARRFVESLDTAARTAFLDKGELPRRIPVDVEARIAALLRAFEIQKGDARLAYFRGLVDSAFPDRSGRAAALGREYVRVMRFVYQKEFVAQRAEGKAESVAELYRRRGLSTDTAIEAGYVVYLGLGVLRSLEPGRQVRRVLIVGPGLDLAPRTSLREAAPPESYQPWAIIDALLALGLSRPGDLQVTAADINPRVVDHLRRASAAPPALRLLTELQEEGGVVLAQDYRDYFATLGARIVAGKLDPASSRAGHLTKTVQVSAAIAQALRAETLDIVSERLPEAFDLIVATNILPYFDDRQLTLAVSNIGAMLAPGGTFLHNEPRPVLGDLTAAAGMPFRQSRHAVLATVKGAPAPLFDNVFLHTRPQ